MLILEAPTSAVITSEGWSSAVIKSYENVEFSYSLRREQTPGEFSSFNSRVNPDDAPLHNEQNDNLLDSRFQLQIA